MESAMEGKSKNYYPICLDIEGERCLVVGGGRVAERKVLSLLECGARVVVVSPGLTVALQKLAESGKIEYMAGSFEAFSLDSIEGVILVIAATDDPQVNAQVSAEARKRRILVNVVDAPELCSYLVPAVVRRGPLVISVSTSGKSPLLARHLRQELAERYGPEYAEMLEALQKLRRRLKEKIAAPEKRRAILSRLLAEGLLDLMREGREDLVEERVKKCISSL